MVSIVVRTGALAGYAALLVLVSSAPAAAGSAASAFAPPGPAAAVAGAGAPATGICQLSLGRSKGRSAAAIGWPAVARGRRRGTLHMGGAEEALSNINDLKARLEAAVGAEDYFEAARLRDEIASRNSDASLGVLGANAEFYRSFREGDKEAMERVWGDEEDGTTIACIHPAMPLITGRQKVMASWHSILGGSPPNIRPENAQLVVNGDAAWVMCEEVIDHGIGLPASKCMATNIFVHRKGSWRMVLHQGGPLISPQEFDPIL